MLQKTTLVRFKKAIETLYDAVCTVTVSEEYEKANGATAFHDVVKYEDQPCRISQQSGNKANNDYTKSNISKEISLFIAPELVIPAGSKIIATYNGTITHYINSGIAAKYDAYQQIKLEIDEKYA